MRGEEASGMKLPDVAVFAPFLSARPLLSCHWSIVALFVCRCSARLSLVHCWSARVGVAVLSLSCRCPVAVLSLSCRCPVAGLPLVCLLGLGVARPSRLSLVFLLGSG